MAITKQKKVEIIGKLGEIKDAQSVVFVNFHGLPVATVSEMRKSLRGKEVKYFVAKKTLIRKAFADFGIEGTMPELPGEIALAYSADLINPAKGIYEYQKKNPELVNIVGGVFEGKYLDAKAMLAVATIPDQKTLYTQFVNVINSPIQGLVMALDAIARKREAVAA